MSIDIQVVLVRSDGSLLLAYRAGRVGGFCGQTTTNETPQQAALRIIKAQTNLPVRLDQLQFYRKCLATKGHPNETHFYIVTDVIKQDLEVPAGHIVISNSTELTRHVTEPLLKQVLTDYFEGFRSFMFLPDIPSGVLQTMADEYYMQNTSSKQPSSLQKPVVITCTGLVAAGKSTVTSPLAKLIDAVPVSSDRIRGLLFQAGYNFKELQTFITKVLQRLTAEKYNIFLDYNISTNMPRLDALNTAEYRIFIVHANPLESFIKHKILSGNMKHELSFFPKDEYLYESMQAWKHEHLAQIAILKEKYGIWYEVDTSRSDLKAIMQDMAVQFKSELTLK